MSVTSEQSLCAVKFPSSNIEMGSCRLREENRVMKMSKGGSEFKDADPAAVRWRDQKLDVSWDWV